MNTRYLLSCSDYYLKDKVIDKGSDFTLKSRRIYFNLQPFSTLPFKYLIKLINVSRNSIDVIRIGIDLNIDTNVPT